MEKKRRLCPRQCFLRVSKLFSFLLLLTGLFLGPECGGAQAKGESASRGTLSRDNPGAVLGTPLSLSSGLRGGAFGRGFGSKNLYGGLAILGGANNSYGMLPSSDPSHHGVNNAPQAILDRLDFHQSAPVSTSTTPNEQALAAYLNANPNPALNLIVAKLDKYLADGDIRAYNDSLDQMMFAQQGELSYEVFNQVLAVSNDVAWQLRNQLNAIGDDYEEEAEEAEDSESQNSEQVPSPQQHMAYSHGFLSGRLGSFSPSAAKARPSREGVAHMNLANNPDLINRHPLMARSPFGKVNIWLQPFGHLSTQKGVQNAPTVKTQLGGFTVGADYQITRGFLLGILGGLSKSFFNWSGQRGWGQINAGNIGIYGGWKPQNGFYMSGQVIIGSHAITTNRVIRFADISLTAKSQRTLRQLTGNIEIGQTLPVYTWFVFQPFLMTNYMTGKADPTTERGAGPLNTFLNANFHQFVQWELGAMIYRVFVADGITLRPTAELGWIQRRATSGSSNTVDGGFLGSTASVPLASANKVYNQLAPGVGLMTTFPGGFYINGNVYAACGSDINLIEGILRAGLQF